jgi:hypothetical protein
MQRDNVKKSKDAKRSRKESCDRFETPCEEDFPFFFFF